MTFATNVRVLFTEELKIWQK